MRTVMPPGFPVMPPGIRGKEPTRQFRRHKRCGFDLWVAKIPWRRAWKHTPVFLLREFYGQRSLVGCIPQDHRVGHDCSRCSATAQGAAGRTIVKCMIFLSPFIISPTEHIPSNMKAVIPFICVSLPELSYVLLW